MLWLALLLVGIPCLLLWDYLRRKRRNDMLHYMPGPATLPSLGNVLLYRGIDGERECLTNPFVLRLEQSIACTVYRLQAYGRMYRIWALYQLAIFSTDPRDVQFVLSSPQLITKNNLYNLLRPWLGTGLLMSTGSKWRARRKIITPTFHFKILERFVDIFDQQSTILVLQLQQHADGRTPLNIFPFIFLAALDIIAETAMGTKVNAQRDPHLPYVQAVYELTSIMTDRFIKPWQRNEWIFRLLKPTLAKKQDALIRIMHEFTECIIKQRREALVQEQQQQQLKSGDEGDVPGQRRRLALLDVLLQAIALNGAPLSDEEIREEVDTFMFEGHDTTTSGISFCLYEISRHAAVQQRLIDEIDNVFGGDRQRALTLRDLNDLKYLECVIKEALRLYPSVPIIART